MSASHHTVKRPSTQGGSTTNTQTPEGLPTNKLQDHGLLKPFKGLKFTGPTRCDSVTGWCLSCFGRVAIRQILLPKHLLSRTVSHSKPKPLVLVFSTKLEQANHWSRCFGAPRLPESLVEPNILNTQDLPCKEKLSRDLNEALYDTMT